MKKTITLFALMAVMIASAQVTDTISYADTTDVKVYSLNGQNVYNGRFNDLQKDSLSKGVYLVYYRFTRKTIKIIAI